MKGLIYKADFITEDEEKELLKCIDNEKWSLDLSRRTQHYGYKYNYTSKTAKEKAPKIPDYYNSLIKRLTKLGYISDSCDLQMIINEYVGNQGISAHVDKVNNFGDKIIDISLGEPCIMRFYEVEKYDIDNPSFERTGNKEDVLLENRSLVVMTGDSRYFWQHSIPSNKTYRGKDGKRHKRKRRVSITIRKMN